LAKAAAEEEEDDDDEDEEVKSMVRMVHPMDSLRDGLTVNSVILPLCVPKHVRPQISEPSFSI
jgi:hypothetical protein